MIALGKMDGKCKNWWETCHCVPTDSTKSHRIHLQIIINSMHFESLTQKKTSKNKSSKENLASLTAVGRALLLSTQHPQPLN